MLNHALLQLVSCLLVNYDDISFTVNDRSQAFTAVYAPINSQIKYRKNLIEIFKLPIEN